MSDIFQNRTDHFIRDLGDYDDCLVGIALMHVADDVVGDKLEDDRIGGSFPAVDQSCRDYKQTVESQHIIPHRTAELVGKIDGKKIQSATGGIMGQGQAHPKAVDQSTEYRDQQHVIQHVNRFKQRSQNGNQNGLYEREHREHLSDPSIYQYRQHYIDDQIQIEERQIDVEEISEHIGNDSRKTRNTARVDIRRH